MEYYNVENCRWEGVQSILFPIHTSSLVYCWPPLVQIVVYWCWKTSKSCPFLNICLYWSPLCLVNVSSGLTSKKNCYLPHNSDPPVRNIQRITVLFLYHQKKLNKELKNHIWNGFVVTKESFIKSIDCNSGGDRRWEVWRARWGFDIFFVSQSSIVQLYSSVNCHYTHWLLLEQPRHFDNIYDL